MDGGPNTTSGSPRDQAIILEDLNPGFSPVVADSIADAFDMEALSPGISIPERVPGLAPGLSLINNPIQGGPAPSIFGGSGINLLNALAGPTISIAQVGSGSGSGSGGATGPQGPAGPQGPIGPPGPAGSGSPITSIEIFHTITAFNAAGFTTVSTISSLNDISMGSMIGDVTVGTQSGDGEGIEQNAIRPQILAGTRSDGMGGDILGLCIDLYNTGDEADEWEQIIALQTCATSSAQRAEDDATSGVANVLVDSLGEVLIGTDGNVLLEGSSFNDTWDSIITDTEDILTNASFNVLAEADPSGGVFDTILVDANGDVLTNANASNPEPLVESS